MNNTQLLKVLFFLFYVGIIVSCEKVVTQNNHTNSNSWSQDMSLNGTENNIKSLYTKNDTLWLVTPNQIVAYDSARANGGTFYTEHANGYNTEQNIGYSSQGLYFFSLFEQSIQINYGIGSIANLFIDIMDIDTTLVAVGHLGYIFDGVDTYTTTADFKTGIGVIQFRVKDYVKLAQIKNDYSAKNISLSQVLGTYEMSLHSLIDLTVTMYPYSDSKDFTLLAKGIENTFLVIDQQTLIIDRKNNISSSSIENLHDVAVIDTTLFSISALRNSYSVQSSTNDGISNRTICTVDSSFFNGHKPFLEEVNGLLLCYAGDKIWSFKTSPLSNEFEEIDVTEIEGLTITGIAYHNEKVFISTNKGLYYRNFDAL